MTDNTQPEALRLADALQAVEEGWSVADKCCAELRRQHTRIAELEAQLEAIGAGGVSGPLVGRNPEGITRDDTFHGETYFTAADMATASAQGFRDGVASVAAQAEGWTKTEPLIARSRGEWHEDDGPVVWWSWNGHGWAGESPWCGTPLDSDWPGYHTHWTPAPPPPTSAEGVEHG